jgi:hypothetical protein
LRPPLQGASFGASTVEQLPQTVFPDTNADLGLRFAKWIQVAVSEVNFPLNKPLLDPDGGFNSETAARRFQK